MTTYGYKCFYRNRETEISGEGLTAYAAQLKAAEFFKARKSYEVSVHLCERDGETVTHIASN